MFLIAGGAAQVSPKLYSGMRWRMIGPFRGGRVVAVAGVPDQPDTYYFGGVGGGVWRTTNGGNTWAPIFDSAPIASIGAIAVAPSDSKVIYVGTGEADIRSDVTYGTGVYRSDDAGATWKHVGLEATQHIGRIVVDPKDPKAVLVAALGDAYGPSVERGVFRTGDGGGTWSKVLYQDENTGAIDLAMDAADPKLVFATLWNAHRPPWSTYGPLQGPGGGIYRSADGGVTWKQVTGGGLPEGEWGRAGVAITRTGAEQRVYLILDMKGNGGLYRSDDGGATWSRVNSDRRLWSRGWYFGTVTVDPQNPDIVYLPNVSTWRSEDAGKSFEAVKGEPGGDDYHILWINPRDPKRMVLGCDQGTVVSVDGAKSWTTWFNQPTAQLYHVTTDNQFPYFVYGAQQDSGTVATTSRSDYGSITYRDWYSVGAGEAGYIAPDPSDPNIVYGGDTYGRLFRFDKRTGQSQNIAPTAVNVWGLEMPQRKLRFTWTSPLVFSPQDPSTLYFGSQFVLVTHDRGNSWQAMSPDLTGTEAGVSAAGPVTPANAKQRGYGVVYTIAPSKRDAKTIWVGTDTGLIHVTRDGGKTWNNVTPKSQTDWSRVSVIEASPFDAETAYAAVDRHRFRDMAPHILRTHDGGRTWQEIVSGIPAGAYVRAVREDPERRGLLYAGTETGVYVSFDDGEHWQSLQLNLPVTPVHDLVVHGDDLVIATHGRSFWILDDVTPLRQASAGMAGETAHLFRPQAAIRVRANVNHDTPLPPETPAGQNPPAGAILDYYLGQPAAEVTIEVLDSRGEVVRRYSSRDEAAGIPADLPFPKDWLRPQAPPSPEAGMHRLVWDLRYPAPPVEDGEYSQEVVFGQNTPRLPQGPLVVPGSYQVRLMVGGKQYTEPLKLTMDPRVRTPQAELQAQFETEMRLARAMRESYAGLEQVRAVRKQIKSEEAQAAGKGDSEAALKTLDARLEQVEASPPLQAGLTFASVNDRVGELLSVVDSADAAPTSQALAAAQDLEQQLRETQAKWQEIQSGELLSTNRALAAAGLPTLRSPAEKPLDSGVQH